MHIPKLTEYLERYANGLDETSAGLTVYPPGQRDQGIDVTYKDLYNLAREYSSLFFNRQGFLKGKIVVLYFDNHYDNILWFWSTVFAGGIPAPCPALSKIDEQRKKQVAHLHDLLGSPLFLTREELLNEFAGVSNINTSTIEQMQRTHNDRSLPQVSENADYHPDDLALLMLTSGSSGKSKAVCITHRQLMTAVIGKSSIRTLPGDSSFLNWVGFDHVASLVEIHLQALHLRAQQVHVSPADIVSNPELFLDLLSKHKVGRTFAPNFFLAKLKETLERDISMGNPRKSWDLSRLTNLATGGEANPVDTSAAVSRLLMWYGAPRNVIIPGFGMTETCAGAIFNTAFPDYDIEKGYEFASLGTPMRGIQMRVTVPSSNYKGFSAVTDEEGELEVRGNVVFKEYFNNQQANSDAFTIDGWFRTGDRAVIDYNGNLRLVGRSKETININGVKYSPTELETAIEESHIEGVKSSCVACFHYRRNGMQTESICVVYAPTYDVKDLSSRFATNNTIAKTVMLETGAVPLVLPLNEAVMQKSTLGKLSRAKIRGEFEKGAYDEFQEVNAAAMEEYKQASLVRPATATERTLVQEISDALGIAPIDIGVETPLFDMGISSVTLIKLKRQIESALSLDTIPIITLMTHTTVRSLAAALTNLRRQASSQPGESSYNPVVMLQSQGNKAPLWLFHPGVGEVLVFLNLAKYITDRPVYALRARGFEPNEPQFGSIDETVSCYYNSIKRIQPTGPYAMAGYSYGSMLAFETAKRLEAQGGEVRFLGSFNLPPHIKTRMQQLIWSECLLHLAYFLGLITEAYSRAVADTVAQLPRAEALDFVFGAADMDRVKELDLTRPALAAWADVAFGLQSMATEYDPSGSVSSMDVFCAIPLAVVAENKQVWKEKHLSRWADFVKSDLKIHDVDGSHYTMISEDHVFQFQKKLRKIIAGRGL
ncbi:putative non-ribosomal peptide synthase-like protein [Lojkania enalia]|uniref:Non-ribosomal peptide synthase-like protein n=1 Tax=Lojkania enalia TaxID=147567 RepID=A0A9P4KE77_9PLEO|nr:putative non-ribosomal peptide synthase-like protein [Didymosphaeria enalia]